MCMGVLASGTADCRSDFNFCLLWSVFTFELNVVELSIEESAHEIRSSAEDWNFALIAPLLGHMVLLVPETYRRAGQMCLLVNF